MATVTPIAALTTTSTSNATSYVSASFTPTAGDLLVVFVRAGATAAAGTLTGTGGVTFTKVDHAVFNASADRVYCFVSNAAAAASAQTVTFDCTGDAADGSVIFGAGVSGMVRFGSQAIRAIAKNENGAAAGTPSTSFSAPVLTGNPTLGVVGNAANPATLTPPVNWTEGADSGYATPTSGAEYAYRNSGFSATTITWGGTSATAWGALSIELDVAALPLTAINVTPDTEMPFARVLLPVSQIIYALPTAAPPTDGLPILVMPPRR